MNKLNELKKDNWTEQSVIRPYGLAANTAATGRRSLLYGTKK